MRQSYPLIEHKSTFLRLCICTGATFFTLHLIFISLYSSGIAFLSGVGGNLISLGLLWVITKGCLTKKTDRQVEKHSPAITQDQFLQARKRADFVSKALEDSSQPFASGRLDGSLFLFNHAFLEVTGYTEEELQSKTWNRDLTPPEWRDHEAQVLQQLVESGEPQLYEKEYIRKDGSRVPLEIKVHLIRGENGEPELYYAFLTDISERKEALKNLQASEERLRLALTAGGMGVWTWNPLTDEATWDSAIETITGIPCPAGKGTGSQFFAHVHPEDLPKLIEQAERGYREGKGYRHESRVIKPNGQIVWLAGHATAVKNTQGEVTHLTGVNFDVTERKRSEKALQESEERLRLATEGAEVGIWEIDLRTGLGVWSSEAVRLVGSHGSEFTSQNWVEAVLPEDRARVAEAWQKSVELGQPYEVEFRAVIPHFNGKERWLLSRGKVDRNDEGLSVRSAGVLLDISARKLIQHHLESRERELRALAENTPDILSRFDREYRHVFVNPAVERVTGRKVSEFIGKSNRELGMPTELCDLWEDAIGWVFLHGQPKSLEFQFDSPDGVRHFMGRFIPEFAPDGEVQFVLGVTIDQTLQKAARDDLKESARRKDEFLATLAHELRNPLAPIRTGLQVLKKAPHGDVASKVREMMERQLSHMVRLIDDLLDVARISQGKVELKREKLELKTAIQTAIELSRPLIEGSHHRFIVSLPSEELWLNADLTRLSQIIGNILTNAAKYTPEGGEIELFARKEGSEAIVAVRDNGVGIPQDMLSNVFEMFAQVNKTLDRSQGGLGIGLALVKRLAEMHGGSISVESPGIGKGSTFTIRIPLDEEHQTSSTVIELLEKKKGGAGGRRILVVDDNIDGAESLAMLLSLLNHEVRTAHDGVQALAVAREFQPHIAFLDIGLPEMNGYEVAQAFRDDSSLQKSILIALTGWGSENDKRRSREAGFNYHLTKPVEAGAVEEILTRIASPRVMDAVAPG